MDIDAQTVRDWTAALQQQIMSSTRYAGIPTVKSPLDAWIYQEIIWERKPQYIVEIGNWCGGSLLMLAHWLDAIGHGVVIGVDIDHSRIAPLVRAHPRIHLVMGDAVEVGLHVWSLIKPDTEVLVIEDSSHEYAQTLQVLHAYEGLVKPGGYFIVEDTICWHGLDVGPRPGPWEAVQAFLAEQPGCWAVDRQRERFGVTWNRDGYLKRLAV